MKIGTRSSIHALLCAVLLGCGSSQPAAGGKGFQITTAKLPDGAVGKTYSAAIQAINGTKPYHFKIFGSSGLPGGLSLADDGTVSGTPLAAGSARFTVVATDSTKVPLTARQDFTLIIAPANGSALQIGQSMLPNATVGMRYSTTLSASGGTAPYVWSIASGALPDGLSLSTTGEIGGTPAAAGSASFSVLVSDASQPKQTATGSFTLVVTPAQGGVSPLLITLAPLPNGTVGQSYSATLAAMGGTPPYTWSLSAGTVLPSGLSLGASGTIQGTPSQAGSVSFTVQVLDAGKPAQAASAQLTIDISGGSSSAPLAINQGALPSGVAGQPYQATVAASGGSTPYAFSVAGGSLPPGLVLSAQGALSGTPSLAGVYAFSIQCSDSSMPAQLASASFSITILPAGGMQQPIHFITSVLPTGTVGQMYTAQLAVSGGTPPYAFGLGAASSLPPGVALSPSGLLSGTPMVAGRFGFTVDVVDSSMPAQSAATPLSINVVSASGNLAVSTSALPSATVGVAYTAQLDATGGTAPYAWTVASGALPGGITLSASGLISGTPQSTGSFGFVAEVQDASSPHQTAQASFMLTVNASAKQGLSVATNSLPPARVGNAYSQPLQAVNGTAPYTWSIVQGALPQGLMLSPQGVISGTPAMAGSASFTVAVTDAAMPAQSAEAQLSLVVLANPAGGVAILTQNMPPAKLGMDYGGNLNATGGTAPYKWSVSQGALPSGLMLDATGGQVSGVPTMEGTFTFTIRVVDSAAMPGSAERQLMITVNPRDQSGMLRVATMTLPDGTLNMAYSQAVLASGGTPPYTFSLASGTLPSGLQLGMDGMVHGTPTERGSFRITVQVADAETPEATASKVFDLSIH